MAAFNITDSCYECYEPLNSEFSCMSNIHEKICIHCLYKQILPYMLKTINMYDEIILESRAFCAELRKIEIIMQFIQTH